MRGIGLRLASAAPLLALAWYVAGLEPSVPLLDHWSLFDLYHALATGQAGWRDFVWPHNGTHVIVLPRLFLSALAFATGWSMKAEIVVSFGLVLATSFAVTRIARVGAGPRRTPVDLANFLSVALLASPVAYWSWVWSCGFFHFLINACAVFGALALVPSRPGREVRQVLTAAAICTVATFSRAEGLGLWIVLIPGLLHRTAGLATRRRLLVGWGLGATVCAAIVAGSLIGLREPPPPGSHAGSVFDDPFGRVSMVASLLGLPLGSGLADGVFGAGSITTFAPVLAPLGTALAVAFGVLALGAFWRRDDPARAAALAWVSIGALGVAFVTASGAIRFGVLESGLLGDFWPSNYATSATLVSLSFIQLVALRASHAGPRGARASLAMMGLSGLLLCGSWIAVTPAALDTRDKTRNSRVCWEVFERLDAISSCFGVRIDEALAKRVEETGFRTIRRDLVYDAAASGLGAIERERPRAIRGFELTGWVRTESDGEEPIVFISKGESEKLFALAIPTGMTGNRMSWSADIYRPPPGSVYRAWRYDRRSGRFERLDGSVTATGGANAGSTPHP